MENMVRLRIIHELRDRGIPWSIVSPRIFDILLEQQMDTDNLLYHQGQMDLLTALVMGGIIK